MDHVLVLGRDAIALSFRGYSAHGLVGSGSTLISGPSFTTKKFVAFSSKSQYSRFGIAHSWRILAEDSSPGG